MAYPDLKFFIDGKWKTRDDGEPVINPSDGSVITTLPHVTRADLDDALAAAQKGFEVWRKTPAIEREKIMLRAAEIIEKRREDIVAAIMLDQGKTRAEADAEVTTAHDRIIWDATEGRRLYGRIIPGRPGLREMVMRFPVGVVAAFTPWNYPLASPTRKVAGALAVGCSIILKGAEETPAGPMMLVQAFADAGVPDGVVNLVFGKPAEISEYLIPHPIVRLITFTGSVPVGQHLASLAGKYMKPAIMELGGNSPVIIWNDVDAEKAAAAAVVGKSRNAGQVCVSPTRYFVHRDVYAPFADAFQRHAAAWRAGVATDPATQMGPLINARRLEAVESYVADAVQKGGKLLAGGQRIGNQGFIYPMTVIGDTPDSARAMREEPFGPLALLTPVNDLDEAIARANSVPFGLAAYAFTDSANVSARLMDELACGSLSINHYTSSFPEVPFGGIKDSGYGREGGSEGLDGYTYVKAVTQRTF